MDDFDMEAAASEVGEGLGFESKEPEVAEPTPSPAPAPAGNAEQVVAAPAATPAVVPAPAALVQGQVAATAPAPAAEKTPEQLQAEQAAEKPPKSWRPEAQAEWVNLSPVTKAEILKREQDILNGIGQYKTEAVFGQTMRQAMGQNLGLLQAHGINPAQHVSELLNVHRSLAFGSPQEKVAVFAQLAQRFGIDTSALGRPAEDNQYVDPEVAHLRNQMAQLQSQQQMLVSQRTVELQRQSDMIRQGLQQELNTFASDPEVAFFDEVANDMALLIQSGRANSLKQAYDLALNMNPELLQKETLRKQAKQTAAAPAGVKAPAAKTAAARSATGVNLKVSGEANRAHQAKSLSLDSTLSDEYDRLMAKG